ncbi:MAG: flavodoxin family protein [bacterium]|nr:flavodoxin family protein [bacterium]
MMKAVAVCGSPREGGNTETLLKRCLDGLEAGGASGELVRLRDHSIRGCVGCGKCWKMGNMRCVVEDDFNTVFPKLVEADIIIVGSPVYFGSATPELMALLDRAGYVARGNGNPFSRKLGGPVVVARRAGQNFTYAQLMYWFTINDMIVAGSTYWNVAFGRAAGDVVEDTEGLQTVDRFVENLVWLAEKTRES